ncbi:MULTISPECIES: GGDEF domain-containing protein [Dyella]|uniref:diguanylate cyclase n=2 Tax=Dyella TaxID=231454 RepID=A0A4R0Z0A6_9GAMM|nr:MULTISPECIES: GGDEF domain-containing protein [Dyella]TBR39358.1 GGDEF domain-containing protein [Dyella terrae]TCI13054.1 GGDEF domain-containing protein [Dyella soli]
MSEASTKSDSINRRFRHIVITIYLVVLAVVVWLFSLQWTGFRDANEARHEYRAVQAAMRAMADVSLERRPVYTVMMVDELPMAQRLDTLRQARSVTDARMAELGNALRDPSCIHCVELLPAWESASRQLADARKNLDALVGKPVRDLSDDELLDGFTRLSDVIPLLSGIADAGSFGVIRENADVQSYLMAARLAALIRAHAGVLPSEFAPALVRHRASTPHELSRIAGTLAKIDQLHQLLIPSIKVLPPSLQSGYATLNREFFGEGLTFIGKLEGDITQPDGVDMTPMQLAERYGGRLVPIDRFRDEALFLANQRIERSQRSHLLLLISSGLFALALTAILLVMTWRFREHVIQPFVDARRFILGVASGNLRMKLPQGSHGSEVAELFSALNVLRENDVKRLHLEQERKRLIGELRSMAETDPLTGLLNRRALEERAQVLLNDKRGTEPLVALIAMDIDHFKSVNDTWGHESGDRALLRLASVCRESVRAEDIVARLGGEEFAIMLRVQTPADARSLADKLRDRLHEEIIDTEEGASFRITSSFGVAHATRDGAADLAELLRVADGLLYQAKKNGRDRVEMQ